MKNRTQTGFTLVELMIALALAAVLLGIGVPAFTNFILNNRMIAVSNDLVTALQFARSEAVKRNNNVTICISSDGVDCTGGANWEGGWIVFEDDLVPDAAVDNSQILRARGEVGGGNTIRSTAGNLGNHIVFTGNGFPRNTGGQILTGTFSICDSRGAVDGVARTVQVGASGRVRTSENIDSCT